MLIARSVHPLPGEAERKERLLALVDGFSSRRVLVVGDLIADEFIYGEVARVSREAPVLILKYDATEMVGGGAGNAANNVAALGGRARLAGLVGADSEGRRLLASFHPRRRPPARRARARVPHAGQDAHPRRRRPLGEAAGRAHRSRDRLAARRRRSARRWRRRSCRRSSGCDAVLLSDYGSRSRDAGARRRRSGARLRARSRRRPIPVLLDSRYRLLDYRGLTACTPNESEVEQVLGVRIGDDAEALEQAGRTLLRRTGMQAVLITRGSRGMALFQPKQPTVHVPIFGSDEVADVTGAGDTVIATFGLALAAGASFYEAARLANYAGGLVVMKRGTATVSPQELADAVDQRSRHDAGELVAGRAGAGTPRNQEL